MKYRFPHIKTHSFRDRLYRIVWRRFRRAKDEIPGENVGRCEHREEKSPRLHIYPGQSAFEILLTSVHESVHACFPDLDEMAVTAFDEDLAKLWKRMKVKVIFEGQEHVEP